MLDIFIITKLSENFFFNCIKSIVSITNDEILKILKLHVCYTGNLVADIQKIELFLKNYNLNYFLFQDKYNFSKCNNKMVKNSNGEYLLFMNDDIQLIDDCISYCYNVCKTKKFGTIGCKLIYADNTIQHAGQMLVVDNNKDFYGLSHYMLRQKNINLGDYVSIGNTGAFMMIERSKFQQFNENYTSCFEDVELNLSLIINNMMNVTCNTVQAYHFESKSRKDDNIYIKQQDLSLIKNFYQQNKVNIISKQNILKRTFVTV